MMGELFRPEIKEKASSIAGKLLSSYMSLFSSRNVILTSKLRNESKMTIEFS